MLNRGNEDNEIFIDIRYLLKALLKRAWAIIAVGVLSALVAVIYTAYFVTPKYSSSVMLYVNNNSISFGNTSVSISASDLSASQSLIDTYIVILKNRTTMEEVAKRSGLDYTYGQLLSMVSTGEYEGTEVFRVTVTSENATDAAIIANTISEVLSERISYITEERCSMRVVDAAVVNPNKVSPSITNNAITAFAIAAAACAFIFAVFIIFDDTIHGDDYISQNYEKPILSRIPDLAATGNKKKYGYYYKNRYYRNDYSGKADDEK